MISPLEQQKNNREFEIIVQTCIMNTIRDNIPIDQILRQYIDETQEVDVETAENIVPQDSTEEVKEEKITKEELENHLNNPKTLKIKIPNLNLN